MLIGTKGEKRDARFCYTYLQREFGKSKKKTKIMSNKVVMKIKFFFMEKITYLLLSFLLPFSLSLYSSHQGSNEGCDSHFRCCAL